MSDVFYMILGVGLFAAMVLYAFVSPLVEDARDSARASQGHRSSSADRTKRSMAA